MTDTETTEVIIAAESIIFPKVPEGGKIRLKLDFTDWRPSYSLLRRDVDVVQTVQKQLALHLIRNASNKKKSRKNDSKKKKKKGYSIVSVEVTLATSFDVEFAAQVAEALRDLDIKDVKLYSTVVFCEGRDLPKLVPCLRSWNASPVTEMTLNIMSLGTDLAAEAVAHAIGGFSRLQHLSFEIRSQPRHCSHLLRHMAQSDFELPKALSVAPNMLPADFFASLGASSLENLGVDYDKILVFPETNVPGLAPMFSSPNCKIKTLTMKATPCYVSIPRENQQALCNWINSPSCSLENLELNLHWSGRANRDYRPFTTELMEALGNHPQLKSLKLLCQHDEYPDSFPQNYAIPVIENLTRVIPKMTSLVTLHVFPTFNRGDDEAVVDAPLLERFRHCFREHPSIEEVSFSPNFTAPGNDDDTIQSVCHHNRRHNRILRLLQPPIAHLPTREELVDLVRGPDMETADLDSEHFVSQCFQVLGDTFYGLNSDACVVHKCGTSLILFWNTLEEEDYNNWADEMQKAGFVPSQSAYDDDDHEEQNTMLSCDNGKPNKSGFTILPNINWRLHFLSLMAFFFKERLMEQLERDYDQDIFIAVFVPTVALFLLLPGHVDTFLVVFFFLFCTAYIVYILFQPAIFY